MAWDNEQRFEADWWGDCGNTLGEQFKHPTYARLMGTPFVQDGGKYVINKQGKTILDFGGGPTSMLLCTRADRRVVVDPCPYPYWTQMRYAAAGIELVRCAGEDFYPGEQAFDEAWCYNCLQHVRDPKAVIETMRRYAKVLRIFEWVNIPAHEGHPHELKSEQLAEWAGLDTWGETWIGWDHWLGGPYNDYLAFHGYTGAGL